MIHAFCVKISAALAILLVGVSLAAAQPSALPLAGQDTAKVAGTEWNGSESLDQYGKLTFRFTTADEVVMIDAHSQISGSYTQDGAAVRITFGDCVYEGSINGNVLSGTARFTAGNNTGVTWTFNVTLQNR